MSREIGLRFGDPARESIELGGSKRSRRSAFGRRGRGSWFGKVADVRPITRKPASFVAPLRIARGSQNKVLEACCNGTASVVVRVTKRLEGPTISIVVQGREALGDSTKRRVNCQRFEYLL